jgi:hypothetical protein
LNVDDLEECIPKVEGRNKTKNPLNRHSRQ